MDLSEFEQDRQIDLSALDKECTHQADLYFKWASRAAKTRSTADLLELQVDVTEARLQAAVRRDPERYKVEAGARGGVTEAAVKATVLSHPEYIQAKDAWLQAREDAAILDKAEKTMEHKKRMLELLVSLHGQSYFADPKIPKALMDPYKDKLEARSGSARSYQKSNLRKAKE